MAKPHIADVYPASKRLYGHVLNTPLIQSAWLSAVAGVPVHLKLENLQRTGSFKFRGALNALKVSAQRGVGSIVTASAGNHGLGVCEAATTTRQKVTVCVPENVSEMKLKKLQQYEARIIVGGASCDEAEARARQIADETDSLYVSPYNDLDVMAGQGTIALEMLERHPDLTTLVVATGGGGLVGGIAAVAKSISKSVRVVGVVPTNAPAMKASIEAGRIVDAPQLGTVADSLAGNIEADSVTFPIAQDFVDEWVSIDEHDIHDSLFSFLENEKMLIEGAAATAVAAVAHGKFLIRHHEQIGVIVCGGNIGTAIWREVVAPRLSAASSD